MSERDATADRPQWSDATPGSVGEGNADTPSVADKAKTAANQAQQTASQVADRAATKANQGMDAAAGGLDSLAGTLRDKTRSLSGQGPTSTVQQAATVAADKLEGAAQVLRQTEPEQLVGQLEDLVRRKPVESVLVAAGVGFVLAKLFR